jgi:hypothetical protein
MGNQHFVGPCEQQASVMLINLLWLIIHQMSRNITRVQDGSSGATRLIVANLTRNVSEDHLREIFGTYGPLAKVHACEQLDLLFCSVEL